MLKKSLCIKINNDQKWNQDSGGSKGGARDENPPPAGGPNSFNFMQFLRKFGKIICWRPPLGSWRPLLGREILDPPLQDFSRAAFEWKQRKTPWMQHEASIDRIQTAEHWGQCSLINYRWFVQKLRQKIVTSSRNVYTQWKWNQILCFIVKSLCCP